MSVRIFNGESEVSAIDPGNRACAKVPRGWASRCRQPT